MREQIITTDADESDTSGFSFLREQLELFGALAYDRHEAAIKLLTVEKDIIQWDECFACLTVRLVDVKPCIVSSTLSSFLL